MNAFDILEIIAVVFVMLLIGIFMISKSIYLILRAYRCYTPTQKNAAHRKALD